MADERKDQNAPDETVGHKHAGQPDRERVIGKGMTSPDSTQVPLKAETGEPDWEAIRGSRPDDANDANDAEER